MEAIRTPDPRRGLVLVVLCLSTLTLVIDAMVLTVAVPSLAGDLGASGRDIQWIIDSYLLALAGLLLTSGSLSDRFGRRRVMVTGLVLFGGASALGAAAGGPGQLIAARAVMGIGAALIMPCTVSVLTGSFDDGGRTRAVALWGAVSVAGLVGGPLLGGWLVSAYGWGAVFLVNVPVAVLAVIAVCALVPESRGPRRKADPIGMVLSVIGMTALVWTVIELPGHGLERTGTRVALAVAVLGLTGFAVWERRTPHPMLPVSLFRDRAFTAAGVALVLVTFAHGGLLLVLTQYLQFVRGYTPAEAGLAFTPMAVAALAFNLIGAGVVARTGSRFMTVLGLLVTATGFGVLTRLSAEHGWGTVAAATVLVGAGAGLAMTGATGALTGAVPAGHTGAGQTGAPTALNDTMQQAGAALGVAVLGAVLSAAYTSEMPGGAPEPARRSVAEALVTAARTGDAGLAATARGAFASAVSTGFAVGACGVVAAAAMALLLMRNRKAEAAAGRDKGGNELTQDQFALAIGP
ncbi:MFS transporter [Streptomyces sp. NPDC089799]|uniref:MFS transporter n=1 Tax=Streptomyces sp. NPDC089799 TaxID=3155066 RepID=UPI00344797E7